MHYYINKQRNTHKNMVQQIKFTIPAWPVEQMTGYKPFTTFWQDFSIADRYGVNGIKSTFTKAFREWKDNYKYLTELSMVLNHKIGYFYDQNKPMDARCNRIAMLYSALWEQVNDYAYDTLQGDELHYYYRITD